MKEKTKPERRPASSPRPEQPTITPTSYTTPWDLTSARSSGRLNARRERPSKVTRQIFPRSCSRQLSLLIALPTHLYRRRATSDDLPAISNRRPSACRRRGERAFQGVSRQSREIVSTRISPLANGSSTCCP